MNEPVQPESTERCAVCGLENCGPRPMRFTDCYRLGYELKVRALAEAEKLLEIVSRERERTGADLARVDDERRAAEERLAEAEKERDAPCKACHAPESRVDGMCAKCHRDRGDGELGKKRKVGGLLSETHRALRAAEERAAQAERRLFENGHAILAGDASCCDACDRAVLGRAEPRAAAPEALSDSGAQGEEK